MTTFQFTFWGCIFGFLLFVAALVVLMMYQVNVWKSAVKAFFRMAFGLTVVGLLVQSALQLNHWAYSLLVALVMVVGVSVFAAHKARIRERRYLLPIAIGLVVSVVPMGLAFAFITLGAPQPLDAHVLVPVWGLLLGAMVETDGAALAAYYDGLRHHGQLYRYLLANGANHHEAVKNLFRRALHRSVSPWVRRMGMTAAGSIPLTMWVLLLVGLGVAQAIIFCLLVASLLFLTSIVSIVATLLVARRFSFDAYGQIRVEKQL